MDVTNDAPVVSVPTPVEKKPAKREWKKANALAAEKNEQAADEETNIGTSIKTLRKAKGLSQKAFGSSIGVSRPTVGSYEGGHIVLGTWGRNWFRRPVVI